MKKKVLITGGSGFVGYHLIEAALRHDLEVHVAVRKTSSTDHLKHFPVQYVYPDLQDIGQLKELLEAGGYDYIIHAAGITKAKLPETYFSVNADYTNNLALASMEANIPLKKFVFISSLAALGPATAGTEQITEKSIPAPVTSYGRSKLKAEQYLAQIKDLPLMVFRPTAVYGPRERDIFIMFRTIKRRFEPYIGNAPQQLSFIYAKDLAAIVMAGMFNKDKYNTYNISDGNSYDRYALADISKQFLKIKTLKVHLPMGVVNAVLGLLQLAYTNSKNAPALNKEKLAELQAPNWVCSTEFFRKDLGVAPAYDLKAGIEETLEWYRSNKWL
jgi:nucleoside-diphosphate-sugar epimerase